MKSASQSATSLDCISIKVLQGMYFSFTDHHMWFLLFMMGFNSVKI